MLTWPLALLLVIGIGSLVAAAIVFLRDDHPNPTGRMPARANEKYTPRVGN